MRRHRTARNGYVRLEYSSIETVEEEEEKGKYKGKVRSGMKKLNW